MTVSFQPMPEAASRLRDSRPRLAAEALRAAIRRDPTLETRYDAAQLRTFLRDCDQHVFQLEQALRDGRAAKMMAYVSTIVPVFRRRRVPLEDLETTLLGTLDAARAALPPAQADAAALLIEAGLAQLKRPRHLPGDRPRNRILQLLWKGAGILD
ncbi:MAG TPA: hypothetical protein VN800_00090 [Candidatus Acidoferrales bacterium]|nr:hypothetical protein [Candidatus Acidoferrales bacterium]